MLASTAHVAAQIGENGVGCVWPAKVGVARYRVFGGSVGKRRGCTRLAPYVPETGAYVPDFGTPLAVWERLGAIGRPVAQNKANDVTNTPVQTRKSREQSLKRSSACRVSRIAHQIGLLLHGAATLVAQHPSIRRPMSMMDRPGNCVRHPTRHRASAHEYYTSSPAARQDHIGIGPNFTDGKHFHMVGAYWSLMVQSLPNTISLMPAPPRCHPERARDSCLASRVLTPKRCIVNPFLRHSTTFRREPMVVDESTLSFSWQR